MMMVKIYFLILITLLLSGCSTVFRSADASVFPELKDKIVFPAPASLGYKVSATQLFKGQYRNHEFDIQISLEADENAIRMVGLTPWGAQLYSIKLSNGKLEYREFIKPRAPVNPEYTITDFILTYWPKSVLVDLLKQKGLAIEETSEYPFMRSITNNGKQIIKIEYESSNKWEGKIKFNNMDYGCSFQVETMSVEINE